ncbi:hypothetical protein PIB30_030431 [Stylosanthes scabra]|uniref:Uncharacterized protein n=1 Tax=Stylosanthes scabra TaxID=79078 RepID=A0ABU6QB11_9FABA|nr:hypothetical protein [Stylosanthes scabra]
MEDLSMFQRPKTVALEDENPGTYGTVLIYPLNRLVTRLLILGLASSVDARVSPERMRTLGLMEGVDLPTRPFGRMWLHGIRESRINLVAIPRAERSSMNKGGIERINEKLLHGILGFTSQIYGATKVQRRIIASRYNFNIPSYFTFYRNLDRTFRDESKRR